MKKAIQKSFGKAVDFFNPFFGDQGLANSEIKELLEDLVGHDWQDRMMILHQDLNPEQVNNIIKNASSTTSGRIGAYYELMERTTRDARIGGMVDKRTEAVKNVIWNVQSGNPDNTTANEAADFTEKWLRFIRFKNYLSAAMDGKLYGVKGFENVFFRDGDRYIIEDPTMENEISNTRWHQATENGPELWGRLFIKHRRTDGNDDRLFLHDEDDIHPFKVTTFINKYKRGKYDITGILDMVTKWYIIKMYSVRFWIKYAERHGKPFTYALLANENFKDDEFKTTIKNLLKNLGAERWGVFPSGMDIEMIESDKSGSSELYKSLIETANIEMAIAILGQNLSTEVKGGSFAAAAAHADVEEQKTVNDVEWLQEEINDKQLHILTKVNFPDLPEDDYPKISLTPRRNIDLRQLARGYQEATKLVDVPKSVIYNNLQIRKPRLKDNAENLSGAEKYDEEIVGPSNPASASRFQQIAEGNLS